MVSTLTIYSISIAVTVLAIVGLFVWDGELTSPILGGYSLPAPTTCDGKPSDVRVFTQSEISVFRTQTESRPLLLVVLGEVFDVSEGKRFYGPGEGYFTFIGQDNSRAFSSGAFGEVNDEVLDMTVDEIKTVVGWLSFYKKHKAYEQVGVLQGRYFDCDGKETAERRAVLARAEEKKEPTMDELLLARQQFCHISSSGSSTTLACHKGRYPRLLRYTSSGRAGGCVCPDATGIKEFESSAMLALELYSNCSPTASVCTTNS